MYVPAIGDKVKVVLNADPRLKSYVGKHGKVVGGVTKWSCRVKLAYDIEVMLYANELELLEASHDVESTTAVKRRAPKRRNV